MIEIDHICIAVQNVYEGSQRLRDETGVGHYEGGWFPAFGLANRIFPLGDDTYIEVESVIDTFALKRGIPAAQLFHDAAMDGDVFLGWCAKTDSREELEELSQRSGVAVIADTLRTRPDGSTRVFERVPASGACWKRGVPNLFLYSKENIAHHPARVPSEFGTKTPLGISWMEVGGTRGDMAAWIGESAASSMPLDYNGRMPGLYAVAVRTDQGEVVIRRRNHLEAHSVDKRDLAGVAGKSK
jgi:hypothetical protein